MRVKAVAYFCIANGSDTHDEKTPWTQSKGCLGLGLLARGRSRGPSSRLCPVTSREFPCALASDPMCRGVCVRAREMAPRGSKNDRKAGGGVRESVKRGPHAQWPWHGERAGVRPLPCRRAGQRAEKESLHVYKAGCIHSLTSIQPVVKVVFPCRFAEDLLPIWRQHVLRALRGHLPTSPHVLYIDPWI